VTDATEQARRYGVLSEGASPSWRDGASLDAGLSHLDHPIERSFLDLKLPRPGAEGAEGLKGTFERSLQ